MKYIYADAKTKASQFTIFSIPKPFRGHIGTIQHNAIASWTLLTPKPEIILFGDEYQTKEICQELGLVHIPKIDRNEYGTPLLNSVFAQVHAQAKTKAIAYLNADIVLTNSFSRAIAAVAAQLNDYLLIGRRWNLDLKQPLTFDADWELRLNKLVNAQGTLADCDCKDYFVFPQHLFKQLPAFALGRGYWDTWMVIEALKRHYSLVDGSQVVQAVHQNHAYTHIRGGKNEAYMGKEAQINKQLGNVDRQGNLACATWQLKPSKQVAISVIIIAQKQKSATAIERALLSVLVQDCDRREVIVLDYNGDRQTTDSIKPYLNEISYHRCDRQDPYAYALQLATGELITFLDADSVLTKGVLKQQLAAFTQEASTLDILLSGCRQISPTQTQEHQPQIELPTLNNLPPAKANWLKARLPNYGIMFRRERLIFAHHSAKERFARSS